ncbi:MAG: hypothetical protein OXN88_17180 [Chloroflexota bacterium]|nr:hypothetical protein [Chloroflexota bacterium]
MSTQEVSRSDILLAILAAADGKKLSRGHLQKVAFLVSEEFKGELPADFYRFDKHNYGPFCHDITGDTDMLLYWGWIRSSAGTNGSAETYSIANQVNLDEIQLAENIKRYIRDTVAWVVDMSFSQLVKAIYLRYPEFLERSIFPFNKEQAIHESFERSLQQLQDGQTTLAADFIDEL